MQPDPNLPIEIAVALLSRRDGRTLVVRKRGTATFIQPGGKLEPGELPVDALRRELEEELALRVSAVDLAFAGSFHGPAVNEPGRTVVAHAFRITVDAVPAATAEIEELAWIDPAEPGDIVLAPLTRDQFLPLVVGHGTPRSVANIDLNRFRLRSFVETLGADSLERHAEPVALGSVARILEGNPKAVFFEAVGPERSALAGNVLGSRDRIARAFGVERRQLLPEILRRLRTEPKIVELSSAEAPVHEVVRVGRDADLTTLPIHLQHGHDGAPYISAAMDFSVDPALGTTNVGIRRMMLRGRYETGIDLVAVSDLRTIYLAALQRGERVPLSVVVGAHPVDQFAAAMRLPVDELGLIATLRDAPLPVVKSVTNDLFVPADAEYVIEGYLSEAGYVEAEGPYGEFLGYYGGVKMNPVFHVTAIAQRRDAVFQTMSISGKTLALTDSAQLTALKTEVLVWRAAELAVREPVAVYANPAAGGVYNVRVAIRQRNAGEGRNVIAAVSACMANVKNVFVVDDDIDIFSDDHMEWALATRLQPDRDVHVESGFRLTPLDPTLERGVKRSSKAGFDLTMPFGTQRGLELSLPEVPDFSGPLFASVRDALVDGPKRFEQLMAAVGSDDGREIVISLEQFRSEGLLRRDPADGRYFLAETNAG